MSTTYDSEKGDLEAREQLLQAALQHENERLPAKKSVRSQVLDLFCICLNISCTVMLVPLNKWIFQSPQLVNMQISFAMWHFTCTSLVLYLASARTLPFRLFTAVQVPIFEMLPLCTMFAGFMILGNLSLAYNSVGFYQLAKIMTTPCVAAIQYVCMGRTISPLTIASLAAVCFGVGLTNSNGAGTSTLGITFAVAAFITTAFYQVWIGKKLVDFSISSPQLLLNQAPISVVMLAFLVPYMDTPPTWGAIPRETYVALVASGVVAALLNLSQFLIIGRMSALTFNVASNVKTIIILTYGWISEGRSLTLIDALGIILALGGASLYSRLSSGGGKK